MQGASFAFLLPTLSILSLPHNLCPEPINETMSSNFSQLSNSGEATLNETLYLDTNGEIVDYEGLWKRRINEVGVKIMFLNFLQRTLSVGCTKTIKLIGHKQLYLKNFN